MNSVDTLSVRLTVEGHSQLEFVAFAVDNSFEGEERPSIGSRLILTKAEWIQLGKPTKLQLTLTTMEG